MLRRILAFQSVYYVVTGIWPWLSMATFEAVTGPKTDDWLVRTVGALVIAIGLALGMAAREGARSAAILTLSAASAAAFIAVDVGFVLAGTIRPIYLGDALVEAAILLGVAVASRGRD
jgi:hypothetical protein